MKKSLIALLTAMTLAAMTETGAAASNPRVELRTNLGSIVVELYADKSPKTVDNFLAYVRQGFYNGTIFHRVIKDFMIQGGGMTPGMTEKPTRAPVKNEADNGLKNQRGTLAMARTPNPDSATAQFFINTKDNDFLDHTRKDINGWGYCVFGKVVSGMEVVDKIEAQPTSSQSGHDDVPVQQVVIMNASEVHSL